MIKVGLFGYGHLGKIHLKCLKETPFQLVGVSDPKIKESKIASDPVVPAIRDMDELIEKSEAVIIASSTTSHYEIASKALERGRHVFLEKPMTSTIEEAQVLVDLARTHRDPVTQVGFVERYNPAFIYLRDKIMTPRFIEVHRLANFNPRGNDVSVVFDLMIHDLDILGLVINSEAREIRAHGVSIISDSMDICNARIEFTNGSVANLTASRMSMKQMRKFRIFQESGYLSMDLDNKKSQVVEVFDQKVEDAMFIENNGQRKYLKFTSSGTLEGNAIVSELNDFYSSIQAGRSGPAGFESAFKTSLLADQIEKIALASSHL